jgi:hypothetical protein
MVARGAGREAYEALPADDPHHMQTAAERRADQLDVKRRAFVEEVRLRSPERAALFEARWFAAAG